MRHHSTSTKERKRKGKRKLLNPIFKFSARSSHRVLLLLSSSISIWCHSVLASVVRMFCFHCRRFFHFFSRSSSSLLAVSYYCGCSFRLVSFCVAFPHTIVLVWPRATIVDNQQLNRQFRWNFCDNLRLSHGKSLMLKDPTSRFAQHNFWLANTCHGMSSWSCASRKWIPKSTQTKKKLLFFCDEKIAKHFIFSFSFWLYFDCEHLSEPNTFS